jgi:hypothetical protein
MGALSHKECFGRGSSKAAATLPGGNNVRFASEATAVDVRFETDGRVRPRRFMWERAWLNVSDVGRHWMDEAGRHVLVMVEARHTFELLLERESLSWRVIRAPDGVVAA